jgi:hypothetical protein
MRTTRLLASVVAVVGAATAVAAPSGAQTAVDQQFLGAVRDKGVPIESDAQALDLAHSTCGVLNNGGSGVDALTKITKATHWSQQQVTDFGGLAVVAYCNDKMAAAIASLQQAPQDAQEPQPKTGPKLNVTDGPAPLPVPPPEDHMPYGGRFGAQDSSPFS